MKRRITVDFNRVVGDLIRANARRAVPGTAVEVGSTVIVGDDDWGVAPAEIVEYDDATGALVLRVLGELQSETATPATIRVIAHHGPARQRRPSRDASIAISAPTSTRGTMTAGTGVSSATPQIPDEFAPAAVLIARTERYWSVVRLPAVKAEGQVHLVQLDTNDPEARALLATVA